MSRQREGYSGKQVPVTAPDGTRLYVEVDGPERAEVTVVFIHGIIVDLATWIEQREFFQDTDVRRVFYDHRGHGRSGWRGLDPSIAGVRQLGDDLAAVIEATAPTGRVVLVGHSMGGMTIMGLAAQQPRLLRERVAGVLLVSTSAGPLRKTITLGFPDRMAPVHQLLRLLAVPVFAGVGRLPHAAWRRVGLRPSLLAASKIAVGPSGPRSARTRTAHMVHRSRLRFTTRFVPRVLAHDERMTMARLEPARTVVLSGDRERLVPHADSLSLARLADGARLVVVDGAGHMLPYEAPDIVSSEIAAMVGLAAAETASARDQLA
ncbi:alpha/beta fold hydrolase [Nocardioides speluncae]|uniref:alpha/beta fold hydrolase n=1 Tax=Nocardioides speluncae TaxID=2670337 RepID=UPI001F0BCCD0|nr:alpha/beta hydrolase [Nocardioides speluncae]